jgi:uncharacterized membrane protein YfcA
LISLPTVAVGVLRHIHRGSLSRAADWIETIVPMGAGSIAGALLGGVLVAYAPATALKVGLGGILIWSAGKLLRRDD